MVAQTDFLVAHCHEVALELFARAGAYIVYGIFVEHLNHKALKSSLADIENAHSLCEHCGHRLEILHVLLKPVDRLVVRAGQKLNKQSAREKNLSVLLVDKNAQRTNRGNLLRCSEVVCDILGNLTAAQLDLTDIRVACTVVAHDAEGAVFADSFGNIDFAAVIVFCRAVGVFNITANIASAFCLSILPIIEVAQRSLPSAAVALRLRLCSFFAVKTISDASIAEAIIAPSLVIQRIILSIN